MAQINEKELNRTLRSGPPSGVFLLYGSDHYLVDRYAALIVDRAVKGDKIFNYERIDGAKIDFDHLYDSVLTLPMMADRRAIVLDDPDIDKLSAGDLDKLLQILGEAVEPTVLVIAIKQNEFLPKKSNRCRKVLEAVDRLGIAAELGERSAADLAAFVIKRCAAAGCSISKENANLLVSKTTGELIAVQNEADKVIAFTGSGEVAREAIDRLVSATVEAEVFSLSKAILAQDYTRAQSILAALIYLREPAVNILHVLSMAFVDLCRARASISAGVETSKAASDFGYRGREFAMRNAYRDCRKLPQNFLRRALEVLAQADFTLKSSGADEKIVLQKTITELFLLLGEERA